MSKWWGASPMPGGGISGAGPRGGGGWWPGGGAGGPGGWVGFDIPQEPAPDATSHLAYAEFLDALTRMRQVGFPIERDPAEAWPDFVGWRLNYERAAYSLAPEVGLVPPRWSGPG